MTGFSIDFDFFDLLIDLQSFNQKEIKYYRFWSKLDWNYIEIKIVDPISLIRSRRWNLNRTEFSRLEIQIPGGGGGMKNICLHIVIIILFDKFFA